MHVIFDPDSVNWSDFFDSQYGGAYYFEGLPFQRGAGIGAVFSNLFKYLLPIGKSIGRELGKEGLDTGARILNRLATGQNLKASLTDESQQGLKNLVDRVYEKRQKGEGRKKKTIKGVKKKTLRLSKVAPPKRIDYLGSY